MTVTKIAAVGKSKSRVYIDEQLAFVLYRGELSRYRIKEGEELPEEVYQEITEVLLVKRAKLRCMNLLKSMDRTEWQLRQKLFQGEYANDIIDKAIEYVKSYGYVDDEGYADRYIEYRKNTKSRMQITRELMQKGVGKEIIQAIFEKNEPVDESELILKWIEKKRVDLELATPKEKQKLYMFLLRKGFSSDEVRRVMRGINYN